MSTAAVIRVRQLQPFRLRVTGPDRRMVSVAPAAPEYRAAVVGALGPASQVETYQHHQAVPSAVWTINHNRGQRPNVKTYTEGWVEVIAQVQSPNLNQTIITLAEPMTGFARLI